MSRDRDVLVAGGSVAGRTAARLGRLTLVLTREKQLGLTGRDADEPEPPNPPRLLHRVGTTTVAGR